MTKVITKEPNGLNAVNSVAEANGGFGSSISGIGTGLVARTAANTYAARTLTGPAAGISVSNGAGVAGNPTLALTNDLAAVEALAGTGLATRTATDTWTNRSLTAPAAGMTITNNDGVSGNPTFAFANDLAALEALTTTGLAVRPATDTWTNRSLTAPAAGITISNNDGVAGNPTFALANDLAALEGLSSTGFAVRTATDTWAQRTLTAGTGIAIANGNGVAGSPSIDTFLDVQTFSTPGAATWTKPASGKFARIVCIGGGGGGGSGRRAAAAASGGGAGGGGGYSEVTLPLSVLGATESVTVGAAGTGGAAIAADNTNGNPGVAGGQSLLGLKLSANGGGAGGGGTTTGTTGGNGGAAMFPGGNGGAGNLSTGGIPSTASYSGAGGGGGGGWNGATAANGSSSQTPGGTLFNTGLGGVAPSGAGGNGTSSGFIQPASGGGGGAASAGVAAAGNGGNGATYGGAGGGGGGTNNGVNSGAGGNGAAGIVVVYVF